MAKIDRFSAAKSRVEVSPFHVAIQSELLVMVADKVGFILQRSHPCIIFYTKRRELNVRPNRNAILTQEQGYAHTWRESGSDESLDSYLRLHASAWEPWLLPSADIYARLYWEEEGRGIIGLAWIQSLNKSV